jgi:hypothetical protein
VTSYLQALFDRGAFAGQSASSAFTIACDGSTDGQLVVGIAPLLPGLFVYMHFTVPSAS